MQPSANDEQHTRTSSKAAQILIIVFFLVFASLLTFLVVRGYWDVRDRAAEQADSASQVVATNAHWISEVAEQALRRMDTALGPDIRINDSGQVGDMRATIDSLPVSAKAYIVAADGHTLFTTDPDFKPLDIRDRPYFKALEDGAPFYTSSLLVSRLDDEQIFVFSKRIERLGVFVGAAIISFNVELFRDVWHSLDMEVGSTVSIIRDDGMLVARYPRADGPVNVSQQPLFTQYLKEDSSGNYVSKSIVDGVERVVAYRRVPGTNLVAIGSMSLQSAIDQFWHGVLIVLALIVPIAIGLTIAAIWITFLLQRDARRQEEVAEALATNTLLFREIHHRVKNNLQSMLSLVRIQNLPAEAKLDLQSRFAAMAAVHEHMYQHDSYAELEAGEFIPSIVQPILKAHASAVSVTYEISDIMLSHDKATPLALLINEVVTNALKYAFETPENGEIILRLSRIDMTEEDDNGSDIELVIADNGAGFDPENITSGMGTRLIDGVVRQLDGTYTYHMDNGTNFTAKINLH